MQNQIQIFENKEFGKLEVLMLDGKPYFPATECAKILGYATPRHAISRHCKGGMKRAVPTKGGVQERIFIPEGDLYRLIIRSKLPAAVRFEAFVCDEVLPAIRKHGAYATAETLRAMQDDPAFTAKLIDNLGKIHYYDTILQSPKALPVSVIAKDYSMTAKAFNRLLHKMGIQYKVGGTWLLYKKYTNLGYTLSKTCKEVTVHTCWTQKGRLFLYDILKEYGFYPDAEKGVA